MRIRNMDYELLPWTYNEKPHFYILAWYFLSKPQLLWILFTCYKHNIIQRCSHMHIRGYIRRQSNSCFFSLTRSLFYTFDHNAIWATHSITCFRDARSDVNGNGCKAYILNTYAYTHIHLILIWVFCKNYS